MFTESDLKELLEYRAEHPVLSVYLNMDPSERSTDVYKLRLRSMLKDIELDEDVIAVEHYFDHEYDWSGRSVKLDVKPIVTHEMPLTQINEACELVTVKQAIKVVLTLGN